MELIYRQRACCGWYDSAAFKVQGRYRCGPCFLRFGEHRGLRVSYGESRKNTVHLQMCVIG